MGAITLNLPGLMVPPILVYALSKIYELLFVNVYFLL